MNPLLKLTVGVAAIFAFMALVVFLPAGTLDWPEGWLYVLTQSVFSSALAVWLWRKDPALLEERASMKKGAKGWDKALLSAMLISIILLFAVAGFDAVRFNWSSVPLWLKALGYAGVLFGLTVMFLVLRENTYSSKVVRIQKERGHKVVTTGPYAVVRHPMYVGMLPLFPGLCLLLGSYYALPFGLLFDLILIVRTSFEDKLLHRELPGYKEYAQKTRYKMLPGLW